MRVGTDSKDSTRSIRTRGSIPARNRMFARYAVKVSDKVGRGAPDSSGVPRVLKGEGRIVPKWEGGSERWSREREGWIVP